MPTKTQAQTSLDQAGLHVQNALDCLGAVVVNACHGTDTLPSTEYDCAAEALDLLLSVRRLLRNHLPEGKL